MSIRFSIKALFLVIFSFLLALSSVSAQDGLSHFVKVYDSKTGEELTNIDFGEIPVEEAVWNPDGSMVYTKTENAVQVWDAVTGEELLNYPMNESVLGIVWSPDSEIIAIQYYQYAEMWDARSGEQLSTVNYFSGEYFPLFWSPDGSHVIEVDYRTLKISDVTDHISPITIENPEMQFTSRILWRADSHQFITIVEEQLQVRDTDGNLLFTYDTDGWLMNAIWDTNFSRLLVSTANNIVMLDAMTGEVLLTFDTPESVPFSVQWIDHENRVIATSRNGLVRVWDSFTGEVVISTNEAQENTELIWNENAQQILSMREEPDGKITITNLSEDLELFADYTYLIDINIIWSPDGSHFIRGTHDEDGDPALAIHSSETGEVLYTFVHSGMMMYTDIVEATWSADGNRILARSWGAPGVDRIVVWDILEGKGIVGMSIPMTNFDGAVWSSDETKILTWGLTQNL